MTDKPGIVFFGTPVFAVPSLELLHASGHPILAVVTAPDKPAGRGQKLAASAIKEFAVSKNIPVLQPINLSDESFIDSLKKLNASVFVVVAFRMLPKSVWSLPPLGTFNLHASLLPQYRGSAPINWAIINGEKETGLTTFFIEEKIDTGKIIFQERTMIGKSETAGELHDRLKITGATLVQKTVDAIIAGNVITVDQAEIADKQKLKPAPKLNRENTRIDKTRTFEEACNFIHGLSPHPGAHTQLSNKMGISFSLKIFYASPHKEAHNYPAGTVMTDNKSFLKIYLRGGYISVEDLQLAGRNRSRIKDFLNGLKFEDDWFIE